jgi:outer membrane protein
MIRNYVTVFLLLVTFSFTLTEKAVSQQVLTLQEAVESGLENNFGIRISQNLQEQASNNFTVGNAGFLPSLELTASRNESIDDSEFESAGGDSQTNTGARSTTTSAALNLNWTIFDGLRMFSSYNRLGKLKDVSDELLRSDMENLVSQIALSYFNIIRISEQIKVLQNNIDVSRERIEIEEAKVDIGSGSEYDLLQARSDLNADRASLLREQNILTEAKILLNELLARDPSTDFDVTRDILVNRFLSRDELYQKLMAENVDLSIARVQREITTLEVREIRGERLPVVSLNSGYRYNRSENDGGFFRFNETTGFSFGVTARVNIFDGFNTSRRVQNAQINQKNAELTLESQKLRLESEFLALFRAYQNSIELVDLEEENLLNAEETLDIAHWSSGKLSGLFLRLRTDL